MKKAWPNCCMYAADCLTEDKVMDELLNLYFPNLNETPFDTPESQWQAWERFVDMLFAAGLALKEKKQREGPGRAGSFSLCPELTEALEPQGEELFLHREKIRSIFDCLLKKGRTEKRSFLPLQWILDRKVLKPVEIMAFLFAACTGRKYKYRMLLSSFSGGKLERPTAGLVHDLCACFLEEEENSITLLLDEDTFFNRFFLEPPRKGQGGLGASMPLCLKPAVFRLSLGTPVSFGCLSFCAQMLETVREPVFFSHGKQFERLAEAWEGFTEQDRTGIVYLQGIRGVGKKFLMRCLGSAVGAEVLCVNLPKLLCMDKNKIREALDKAVLKAVFECRLLYLEALEAVPKNQRRIQWVFGFLQDSVNLIFVGGEKPFPEDLAVRGDVCLIPVDIPDSRSQKKYWKYFAEKYRFDFSEDVDLDQLVSRYDLTPEKIRRSLSCAALANNRKEKGFAGAAQVLEEEIRRQCSVSLGEYAVRIESPFVWEDLQLSPNSRRLLEMACDRVRCRSVVNDRFGFGSRLPYGGGVSIVLYGPPGTGKTMAAQVLAKELGLDIYRVDLSQIESKYVGETEKNLARIFDGARLSNVILFFDEADVLFAKRTAVSGSNDKYANSETAYLLQKMEEYSGVSILATNLIQNFDNAFKRRMTFLIPVEMPDEETRLLLWQKAFPEEAPLEKDIDFRIYAATAQLTGSGIKSAALSAAYRAAAEGRSITDQDLIEAIDLEYYRMGRMSIRKELYTALCEKQS